MGQRDVRTEAAKQSDSAASPPPCAQWFHIVSGKLRGPVTEQELQELLHSGGVSRSDLVSKDGTDEWTRAEEVDVLKSAFPQIVAPPPAPPPPAGEVEPGVVKRSEDGRYTVYESGMIYDSKTKLEWLVGPDENVTYDDAVKWVKECKVAGGDWRMPTLEELKELYEHGKGTRNMDPVFETTGWWVCAEPRDSSLAWFFRFGQSSFERRLSGDYPNVLRVFAARPRR